ncbi:MAG: hypothetical protein GX616_00755, partial [Planctomycetes bacterium]|nr:hypothetical protein [Planctomycetota bacterium]
MPTRKTPRGFVVAWATLLLLIAGMLLADATSLHAQPCLFWEQQNPQLSPSPRYDHAMASDHGRGRVVLVGG